jgi:Flp pilus assembly protein TadD
VSAEETRQQKLVTLRAEDPLFWLQQGQQLLLRERLRDAGQCFDQALHAAPSDLMALNARARTHLALGEVEEALALLEQACSVDGGVAELWNNRGVAQARARESDAALESFARALTLAPDDTSVLCNRAMARVGRGEHELALEDLGTAATLEPSSPAIWTTKAATHLRIGQLRLARHGFLQAASRSWARGESKRYAAALMLLASMIGLVERIRPPR